MPDAPPIVFVLVLVLLLVGGGALLDLVLRVLSWLEDRR